MVTGVSMFEIVIVSFTFVSLPEVPVHRDLGRPQVVLADPDLDGGVEGRVARDRRQRRRHTGDVGLAQGDRDLVAILVADLLIGVLDRRDGELPEPHP